MSVATLPRARHAGGVASTALRTPPHNIEAEQALLGAILLNNEAFDRVSDFLKPEHFSEDLHRRIFEVLAALIRNGKVANLTTLKSHIADADLGGLTVNQYIARLAAEATTIINASDYAEVVRDLAIRRNLIVIGGDIANAAYDAPIDNPPRQQIEEAERRLYAIAETGRYDGGFQSLSSATATALNMAAAAYQRDGHLSGLSTGLADLDTKMGGLQASDLIVIAGRPGMGKTALATNIAFNVAKAYQAKTGPDGHKKTVDGGIVGFFSLEMSAEQLATRIIAEQAEIASYRIRRGAINDAEFAKIADAARAMQFAPLHIDQTGGISIAQLAARARRLKRQSGLDLLIVDYIQLLSASRGRG